MPKFDQSKALLYAVVKTLGRVRIPSDAVDQVQDGDSIDFHSSGDGWVLTYKPSNMVVPGGVEKGVARPFYDEAGQVPEDEAN